MGRHTLVGLDSIDGEDGLMFPDEMPNMQAGGEGDEADGDIVISILEVTLHSIAADPLDSSRFLTLTSGKEASCERSH